MCHVLPAVEDFHRLLHDMKSWVHVPKQLKSALTPEATVKHADKMLQRDYRMRLFMPKDSQYGAMYLCQQAHVDFATASTTGGTFVLYVCLWKLRPYPHAVHLSGYNCLLPLLQLCLCTLALGAPSRVRTPLPVLRVLSSTCASSTATCSAAD